MTFKDDHSLLRPVESVKSSIHAKLSKNDLSNQNTTRFTNSKTKSTNISNQYTGSTSFKGVDLINAEKFSRNELRQPSLSRKDIPPSSNELDNPIQYSNYSSQGIIKGKFSGTIEQQPKIYSVDLPDKSIGSMNATESGLQEEESFIRTSQVFVNEIRKLSLNEKTSELNDVTTITPKNINSIKTNEIQSSFPINLNKTLKSPVNTAFDENNFAPSLIPLKRNDKTNLSKLENSTHGEKESLKDAYEVRKKQKELDRQTFSTLILSTPIKEKTAISKSAIVLYDYDAQDANELSLRENEIIDDIDEIDEGWWTGKNSRSVVGMFPANFVVLRRNDIIVPISSRSELENLDGTQDDQHQIIAVVQEYSTEMTKLFSATVLYDYISKDENEISLTEKENIVEIYAVDDGWWSGINSQGRRGLFPANFVEQSNQSKEGAVSSSMCAKVEVNIENSFHFKI